MTPGAPMFGPDQSHGTLNPPQTDDTQLVALLGTKGYSDDISLSQFAAWAERSGLVALLAELGTATIEDIVAATPLTEPGADALVGVLASLGLIVRQEGGLSLSPLAREYLVPGTPFYMGDSLYLTCRAPMPAAFADAGSDLVQHPGNPLTRLLAGWRKKWRGWDWGGRRILKNQHSRNLPATVAAAQLPLFDDATCVVDVAGGSGTFAIPLAQRLPEARIVLTDLPQAIDGARHYLEDYGVQDRIELIGMDVFSDSWPVPECDVVFIGNLIHGFVDERCLHMAKKSRERLRPGGKLVLHELVWNDNKDGPLKTALFNVTMRAFGGRQRTIAELNAILDEAGFVDLFAHPTAGGFYAVGGIRPA